MRKNEETAKLITKVLGDNPTNESPITASYEKNDVVPISKHLYFEDKIRRIDYILVWEQERLSSTSSTLRKYQSDYRRRYLDKLIIEGVEFEEIEEESQKVMVHFVKVHIPFLVLCKYAELLDFKVPLQCYSAKEENFSAKVLKFLKIPNIMTQQLPYVPPQTRSAVFRKDKMDIYNGYEDEETFFTTTQRQTAAYEILSTQAYGRINKAEVGIDRMIDEGIYTAAYPLHDGSSEIPQQIYNTPELYNRRQILYEYWAKWTRWYKYQPLDNIREYYGEKVALYFAWLGLYTAWLLPASIVGILVFLYGILTMNNYTPSQEICDSGNLFKMCPICESLKGCPYWNISSVCMYSKFTYLFDHPGTIFYSIFMAIWAVTFLENWKRQNATLAFKWDVYNFEDEEERPRPEYTALAFETRKNPVTGDEEPYFPNSIRYRRIFTSFMCLLVMLSIVFIFILGVIVYRIVIAIPMFDNPTIRSKALIFSSSSAAVINLILILALGRVYEQLAFKLTAWEMHRTTSDFEDSLIFKVYLFEFLNFYSSIFYIAFFKGKFNGYPGHFTKIFTLRNEECSNGSCLFELAQQMAIIMVGKQVINNIQEIFVPKIMAWFHRHSKGLDNIIQLHGNDSEASSWSNDFKLIDYEGLFEEYLEMVLQFGFITIFVAAFPLAPLFALMNNWLEIRLDASKLVRETRRPVAERAQDMGTWYEILDFIVKLSIISNGFLIAFTSDFIPKQVYKHINSGSLVGYINFTLAYSPPNSTSEPCRYRGFRDNQGHFTLFHWKLLAIRLGFVILFEHLVFGAYYLINVIIPDVPENLQIEIRKKNYLAKQALLEMKREKKPKFLSFGDSQNIPAKSA